jgi:hypothetical protein
MNGKTLHVNNNNYINTNKLAIICCFQYKKADDYQDLKKRNVLTDLNKYILFCNMRLGINSSNIIILSDIAHLNKYVQEKVITVNSGSQFEQTLRQALSLLSENGFLFFAFSGHGESLDKSCHYVIPSGMGRSHYISGSKIQQLFYYHLPQSCTCLLLVDTCYSGGLLSLKYKINDTIQINKKYSEMGVNRNIICFHSSSKSELSAVFYDNEENGSVFSHYLLLHLINNSSTYIPSCLNIVTKQIYSQRKNSRQPLHHPFVQCTHPHLYYNLPTNVSIKVQPSHKGGKQYVTERQFQYSNAHYSNYDSDDNSDSDSNSDSNSDSYNNERRDIVAILI